MQASGSLAEAMASLDEGPHGAPDAIAKIEQCALEKNELLDLQQMELTDDDLHEVLPILATVASHVKELNLFMNE